MKKDESVIHFKTSSDFEKWLKEHHSLSTAVWIKIAKKASGIPSVTYDEALEIALCYGWIDGLVNKFDDKFYIQRFTPRGKKSMWSKRNREIVAELIKQGRMREAGSVQINAAKKDGRWAQAYDSPKNMKVPEDFLQLLKNDKKAYAFYQTLNKANTFAIAFHLNTAKKPETRERRMQKFLAMMNRGEKLY